MNTIWNSFVNPNEINKSVVDIYGRVPNTVNRNNLFDPNVSQYLFDKGFAPQYPGNKKFAVIISHDVDNIANDDIDLMPVQHFGGVKSAVKMLKNEVVNSFRIKATKSNQNYIPWGMREFASLEKKYKIPASYYFLSLLPGEQDFTYNVNDIAHIFESITKLGGEIGLHGGHQAYASSEKIASEKKLLENASQQNITGYRNHYLRFDKSVTWQALSANGFFYDTTYGDAYSPGFRNGMCYPFMPYDVEKKSFIDLVEIPLVYMDCSAPKYMFLNDDNAWTLFCDLVEKVRRLNGVFTLLWHNTFLGGTRHAFYLKAINYLSKLDPWFATSQQVADHYKEKNYIEQIKTILIDSSNERA